MKITYVSSYFFFFTISFFRHSPPQISVAIASGVRPYVGFHCIIEGTTNPVLTDVAKAVATKVKSAIGQVVP